MPKKAFKRRIKKNSSVVKYSTPMDEHGAILKHDALYFALVSIKRLRVEFGGEYIFTEEDQETIGRLTGQFDDALFEIQEFLSSRKK